jgi:hypothetical protein
LSRAFVLTLYQYAGLKHNADCFIHLVTEWKQQQTIMKIILGSDLINTAKLRPYTGQTAISSLWFASFISPNLHHLKINTSVLSDSIWRMNAF